jgi:hypothetical protein
VRNRFDAADQLTERVGEMNPFADVVANSAALGDLTGDGRPELVVTSSRPPGVVVKLFFPLER